MSVQIIRSRSSLSTSE